MTHKESPLRNGHAALCLGNSNQHRKEANFTMTITKIAAIVALATVTLSLGACCHKQCCQQPCPATVGKSK
jgi:hypothetical protein